MNRDEIILTGLGGAGGKLADEIVSNDPRFQPFFINSSKTDIESLKNYDEIVKNYICTSMQNGSGRNKKIGRRQAGKSGMRILDTIQKFEASTVYFLTSLGGGAGSSTAEVILNSINQLKKQGLFNKTINLIGILPCLNSSDVILKNTLETWDSIMSYSDCINNMIFIDNNTIFEGSYLDEDTINERFVNLFNSIFDIPDLNGTNFDSANLGNILNSKGCMHIYNLPQGCANVEQAMKIADNNSILAKMFINEDLIDIDSNKVKRIKCSYIGTSFNDKNYSHEDVLQKYKNLEEDYQGFNEENNLVLISGMLPPYYAIRNIKGELEDREKNKELPKADFSKFTSGYNEIDNNSTSMIKKDTSKKRTQDTTATKNENMKKILKSNLFDMY